MPDELTGLSTLRDIEAEINTRHDAALLVDVDGMIWVNEQFDMREGDRVLRRVAHVLSSYLSKMSAGIFRVSGDEFLVKLSGGIDDPQGLAAGIVERIRSENIPYRRPDRPERTRLEVNVVVMSLTPEVVRGFANRSASAGIRDWIAERIYREKQARSDAPGVVVDVRSTPWAG